MDDEQLLAAHRNARRAVRLVVAGLDGDALTANDARSRTLSSQVSHLVAAERYVLVEQLGMAAPFEPWGRDAATGRDAAWIIDQLDRIERHWPALLAEHLEDRGLRVALLRMALHTLYHLPALVKLRAMRDGDFELPASTQVGSWEKAIEPLLRGAV
jgi:hypothetical protein